LSGADTLAAISTFCSLRLKYGLIAFDVALMELEMMLSGTSE
jgi:hypothetical protein